MNYELMQLKYNTIVNQNEIAMLHNTCTTMSGKVIALSSSPSRFIYKSLLPYTGKLNPY